MWHDTPCRELPCGRLRQSLEGSDGHLLRGVHGLPFSGHSCRDRCAEELQSDPNSFAMVVLAHLKTQETDGKPDARHAWKVRLIKALYTRGMAAEQLRQLFRFIDWLMDLPGTFAEDFWQEIRHYEEEKHMPFMTTPERLGMEKGLAVGRQEGR